MVGFGAGAGTFFAAGAGEGAAFFGAVAFLAGFFTSVGVCFLTSVVTVGAAFLSVTGFLIEGLAWGLGQAVVTGYFVVAGLAGFAAGAGGAARGCCGAICGFYCE